VVLTWFLQSVKDAEVSMSFLKDQGIGGGTEWEKGGSIGKGELTVSVNEAVKMQCTYCCGGGER
jgi:CRISPR/Cas system CSM-associated protein Csm4 (group 5 of RAMP superfamily)